MLLNARDIQTKLGVSRDCAYRLFHAKAFPSIKLGGRYYVDEKKLEEFLEKYAYKEFAL